MKQHIKWAAITHRNSAGNSSGSSGCFRAGQLKSNNINSAHNEIFSENIWEQIEVENISDELLPFLTTIPLQKLAYYSALDKGFDIDKPRNLAKSVTVE